MCWVQPLVPQSKKKKKKKKSIFKIIFVKKIFLMKNKMLGNNVTDLEVWRTNLVAVFRREETVKEASQRAV